MIRFIEGQLTGGTYCQFNNVFDSRLMGMVVRSGSNNKLPPRYRLSAVTSIYFGIPQFRAQMQNPAEKVFQ